MRKVGNHQALTGKATRLATPVALVAAILSVSAVALAQTAPTPPATTSRARAPAAVAAPAASSEHRRTAAQPARVTAPPDNSAQPVAPTEKRAVVARVGNDDLTADEIRAYVSRLDGREQVALTRDPALLSQAVRVMLANRLVLQEALAKKWEQQPAVAAQLQQLRDNAIAELYLQSVTAPPADYPSEADVQKAYDDNRNAFLAPREFALAQIFVALPRNADRTAEETAKKKLDDIERKLKAPGADFAAVANTANDTQNGGELGWLPEPQIRPEIREQVIGLSKNGVTEPIRLDDGWHVLKLTDTKASFTRTLPEVRDLITQRMRAERAAVMRRAYLAELLKQHPPVLNELALSGLFAKPAQ
jgi:parvulin-like peptidyl-prolyl isomerase